MGSERAWRAVANFREKVISQKEAAKPKRRGKVSLSATGNQGGPADAGSTGDAPPLKKRTSDLDREREELVSSRSRSLASSVVSFSFVFFYLVSINEGEETREPCDRSDKLALGTTSTLHHQFLRR